MQPSLSIKSADASLSRRLLLRSKLLNLCGTLAAIALFTYTASAMVPMLLSRGGVSSGLVTAFSLNVALIMLGWRRSRDLANAIDARERAEARAIEEAAHDYLTGLMNRRCFTREVGEAIRTGKPRALVLFDLDYFKKLNDLHGHAAGDELLREIAARLRAIVPEGSCCARLGGDEFGVLLPVACSTAQVGELAENIRLAMNRAFNLETTVARVSASIGVSVLARDVRDAEAAIRRADLAMYQAKADGRDAVCFFDLEIERRVRARNELEADIREGIVRGQFKPYYQPLIDLDSGELVGFEVLARWAHPVRGLLEPAEFISYAETTGLISDLSLSVMEQAFTDAARWPAGLKLAVNISPLQFRDPLLSQQILKLLTVTGFPARRLEIELTESAILDDQAAAIDTIQSLKNSGITIALDDFGTGYASLAQLTSLPFDRIKIDKSFVSVLLSSSQSEAIVTAIAGLGASLRLPITAEGVETEEVRQHLQALGCSTAQGWLFGRAAAATAIDQMLGDLKLKSGEITGAVPLSALRALPPVAVAEAAPRAAAG